jgi:uridine kinase
MRLPTTPTTTLQRALRDEIRRSSPGGRVIVAVDGFDGSGKTTFARGLAAVFEEEDVATFHASIDGFHLPRSARYVHGRADPEGFYRDSFDYATFRRVLIDPFLDAAQTSATTGFQLAAFDVARDAPVESRWVTGPEDAVLIVDGIFLNRPDLRGLWDWSVWLDVSFEVTFARMAERDGCDPDPEAPSNRRYRLGQQLYLDEADPVAAASAVVDNTDPAHPVRVR